MQDELKLIIDSFEEKINKAEQEYKEKNKGQIDKRKMERYVDRKLKKEIMLINYVNIAPSVKAVALTKRFKY